MVLNFRLHFQLANNDANSARKSYHQPWRVEGNHMAKWADEYREKFRGKREVARRSDELRLNDQRSVNDGQENFWRGLREQAKAAVNDINQSSENLLTFADSDIGQKPGFGIIFLWEGQQRLEATATFDPRLHTVKVSTPGHPGSPMATREYKIVANKNDLIFEYVGGRHSPDAVVHHMLSSLSS
jgi:hypothetical protein